MMNLGRPGSPVPAICGSVVAAGHLRKGIDLAAAMPVNPCKQGEDTMRVNCILAAASAAVFVAVSALPVYAADTVKIGVIYPLTGNSASHEQSSEVGAGDNKDEADQ